MAGRDSREDSAGQRGLAKHRFTGGGDSEAARRGNAQRVYRLADDEFAEHRAERSATVTAPRIRRPPRSFDLNIEALAPWRQLLAKQNGPAVPEHDEVPKLVAGVR